MNVLDRCMSHENTIASLDADNETNKKNIEHVTQLVFELAINVNVLTESVRTVMKSFEESRNDITLLRKDSNFLRGAFWALSIAGSCAVAIIGIALAVFKIFHT